MKKRALVLFAAVALVLPSLKSAQAQSGSLFEGSIVWSMMSPQMDENKHEMVMNIKGEKLEMDIDAGVQGKIKLFSDKLNKMNYIFVEAANMGFKSPIEDDKSTGTLAESDLKATGQKATIAGHATEAYLLKDGKTEMTMWMASDFPAELRDGYRNALKSSSRGGKKQKAAFQQLADKGLLPVKIETKQDNENAGTLELVKIEPKKLDDAMFDLPKGVTFQQAPKGMGGASGSD